MIVAPISASRSTAFVASGVENACDARRRRIPPPVRRGLRYRVSPAGRRRDIAEEGRRATSAAMREASL